MAERSDFNMRDFREGNRNAFNEVFEMFYGEMSVFCLKLIRDEDIAKDIVIDVMTSLFKLHKNFESLVNIRAFLYVSTRNAALNYLKYSRRLQEKEETFHRFMKDSRDFIYNHIDGALLRKIYHSSLDTLPAQTRKVIELIFEDQLTYPQVAAELSISVNTVKGLRKYGLRKIENSLVEQGFNQTLLKLINCFAPLFLIYNFLP